MKLIKLAILGLAFATIVPAAAMAQTGGVGLQLPGVGATSSATTTPPGLSTTTVVTTTVSTTSADTDNNNNDNGSSNNSGSNRRDLSCSPELQSVATGVAATVRLSGGNGTYSVSAPGYTAINTQDNRFTFTYLTPGRKSVVATSGSQDATCVIEVTGESLAPEGASEAEQVTVTTELVPDEEDNDADGLPWLWIILALVVIAGIVAVVKSRGNK
jgi:hypothetical protein